MRAHRRLVNRPTSRPTALRLLVTATATLLASA